MTENKYKFIDLFAGIGGFRLALEKFGHKCVYSVEWNKKAKKVYKANFNDVPKGDIKKIDEGKIPNHNILCAGFPCQAFSISGKRLGFEDTRGTLFFDIARIAKKNHPEVLFLENVPNLKHHNNGETLEVILNTLDNIGYNVFYKVLNASNFGAPTSRKRLYFVCFHKNLEIETFNFPKPEPKNIKLKDVLQSNEKAEELIIERDDIKFKDNKKIQKKLKNTYPNKPIRVGTINNGGQGERIYSPLGHAITFSANGGGAGSKTGAYLIEGKVRKLTPKECARVMGFPEDFKVPVTTNQAHKLFGNSVVIPVIEKIFSKIEQKLNKKI